MSNQATPKHTLHKPDRSRCAQTTAPATDGARCGAQGSPARSARRGAATWTGVVKAAGQEGEAHPPGITGRWKVDQVILRGWWRRVVGTTPSAETLKDQWLGMMELMESSSGGAPSWGGAPSVSNASSPSVGVRSGVSAVHRRSWQEEQARLDAQADALRRRQAEQKRKGELLDRAEQLEEEMRRLQAQFSEDDEWVTPPCGPRSLVSHQQERSTAWDQFCHDAEVAARSARFRTPGSELGAEEEIGQGLAYEEGTPQAAQEVPAAGAVRTASPDLVPPPRHLPRVRMPAARPARAGDPPLGPLVMRQEELPPPPPVHSASSSQMEAMAAAAARAATTEAARVASAEATRAVASQLERWRDHSQGSTGQSRRFSRSWMKAADEIGLPRLAKKPTFGAYRAWRATAERWARAVGCDMGELTPQEVADLAPRLMSPELFQELLALGKVESTWEGLLKTLRWKMGFHRDAIQATLSTTYQAKGESLEQYVARFKGLMEEAQADGPSVSRWFLWNMSEEGRASFAARLERRYGTPNDAESMEELLASIPIEEQFKLASGGQWLSWLGQGAARRREARAPPTILQLESVVEEEEPESDDPQDRSREAVASAPQGSGGARSGGVLVVKKKGKQRSQPVGLARHVERPGVPRVSAVRVQQGSAGAALGTAESRLGRLEEGLPLALELEEAFARREGRPHPLFDVPAAGLHMLAEVLEASRREAAGQRDVPALGHLQAVEEVVLDRVQALAEVHSDPDVRAMAVELVPRQSRRRGDVAPLTLFDVARQFSRRVPLAKLVALEEDVRPYMACIIIDAIREAGDTLVIPQDLQLRQVPLEQFEEHKLRLAGRQYMAYGALSRNVQDQDDHSLNVAVLQREMNEMKGALKALLDMQRQLGDDMEAEGSVTGGVRAILPAVRLASGARELALKAEEHLLAAVVSDHAATLVDVLVPEQPLEQLKPARWDPPSLLMEPQPTIEVGVLGGTAPGLGRVMLDTGAGLSLMSSAVARAHGLRVKPYHATFCVASGAHAKITGEVDVDLQVHPVMLLQLRGVKVQEMGDSYQFLLGADVLRGAEGILDEVSVVTGSRVEWMDRRRDMRLFTRLVNPVGPAGGAGVAQAVPQPSLATQVDPLPPPPPGPRPPAQHTAAPGSVGRHVHPAQQSSRDTRAQHPGQLKSPTLLEISSPQMTAEQLSTLHKLAEERQRQLAEGVDQKVAADLVSRAKAYLSSLRLPRPLSVALGRCLQRRWQHPAYTVQLAVLIQAAARGDDALHAAIQGFKMREDWVWTAPPKGWKFTDPVPPEATQYPPPRAW